MRLKLYRKEAKETAYWFRLLELGNPELKVQQQALLQQVTESMKIFGSMLAMSQ